MAEPLWLPPGFDWRDPEYQAVFTERARRLQEVRDKPELLPALKAFYKDHPAHFIHDWGFTSDPRNAEIGKPTVVPFLLFERQAQFIGWLLERWRGREDGLAEKSRDMGVTWLCAGFAAWMWIFYPGAVVGFGSRKEEYVDKIGDPKSIFWKLRFFVSMLPPEFRPAGYNEKDDAPFMRLINRENGAAIVGEAGDNIGRGNRTSIYFKDESAFYEHADSIDAALSQTSNCKIDVSTPNGSGNAFYRKRHGGRIPVFIFDWRHDPRKGKDWYAQQVQKLDAVILAQEVDRDYESSTGDAWIPGPLVTAASMRGPADVRPMGGLRVGVDPARFGDDRFVVTFRKGRVLLKQVKRQKLDIVQGAAFVKQEIASFGEKPEQIAVDVIGLGAGVADILRGQEWFPDVQVGNTIRKTVVDVNASLAMNDGQNLNLRAFMARQVREWLANEASVPNDPDLKMALTCFKYWYQGGLLRIEDKAEVKKRLGRSPDEYDSLALTFAYPSIQEEQPLPVAGYTPAVSGVM